MRMDTLDSASLHLQLRGMDPPHDAIRQVHFAVGEVFC
jgi:hypothetical protein